MTETKLPELETPVEIDEKVLAEVIKTVKEGTHVDQKLTMYTPFAAKVLIAVEETVPQAGKCTVAGHLLENVFSQFEKDLWDRVAKEIPETSRYGSPDIAKVVKETTVGPDMEGKLKEVEVKMKDKPSMNYITIHSPRVVAVLKYLAATVPKFKKGSYAAQMLENEVTVHLGDEAHLEVLF